MNCRKCKAELPPGAVYCPMCGTKQIREPRVRKRGNGQGSVFKLANGRWLAIVTTGYEWHSRGQRFDPAYLHQKKKEKALKLLEHNNFKVFYWSE